MKHFHFTGTVGSMTYYFKVDLYLTKNITIDPKTCIIFSYSKQSRHMLCARVTKKSIVCKQGFVVGRLLQWSVTTVHFEDGMTIRAWSADVLLSLSHSFFFQLTDWSWQLMMQQLKLSLSDDYHKCQTIQWEIKMKYSIALVSGAPMYSVFRNHYLSLNNYIDFMFIFMNISSKW